MSLQFCGAMIADVKSERKARPFAPYCASGVQLRAARPAKGSPTRGNNDDRRQWRKQGVIVGAAASKTQAKRSGCWVPQPGLVCEAD